MLCVLCVAGQHCLFGDQRVEAVRPGSVHGGGAADARHGGVHDDGQHRFHALHGPRGALTTTTRVPPARRSLTHLPLLSVRAKTGAAESTVNGEGGRVQLGAHRVAAGRRLRAVQRRGDRRIQTQGTWPPKCTYSFFASSSFHVLSSLLAMRRLTRCASCTTGP